MTKLVVALAILLLASCIDVDDFGASWNQTTIDPALAGTWRRLHTPGESALQRELAGQTWRFTLKNGAYEAQAHRDGKQDDEPGYPVKTLAAGKYRFLALGPQHGSIIRYEIAKDRLTAYKLKAGPAWDFIYEHFPDAKNIVRTDSEYTPIKIKTLDDGVIEILSTIPDNGTYWDVEAVLVRMIPLRRGK